MTGLSRKLVRVSAFIRKELVEILRQPRLVVTLVLGPFLVLLAFGAGLRDADPAVRTVFVAPQQDRVAEQVKAFAEAQQGRLTVEGVVQNESEALRRLVQGEVDLVVVIPELDPEAVQAGEQAEITVYHDTIDPIEAQALSLFTRTAVDELNQQLLTAALTEFASGFEEASGFEAAAVVEPFVGSTTRISEADLDLTDFYAPAAVALLLQHLVITFIGLSVVREEQLGTTELFRVAPLTPAEMLLGKFISYLLIGGAVAAVLVALLVGGLGVPVAGSVGLLAVALATLLFTATALGFVIAFLARSDSQAVQYAMLVLLASIFFSGFLLTLDRFLPPLRAVSWALPVTYGTTLLRDVMLRGRGADWWLLAALAGLGVLFTAASWLLVRRRTTA